MIRSIQVETPPSMKGDRHARRTIVELDGGEKMILDNSATGHSSLIRMLLHDTPYEELPVKFMRVKNLVAPDPTPDVKEVPVNTLLPKEEKKKKKKSGLPLK